MKEKTPAALKKAPKTRHLSAKMSVLIGFLLVLSLTLLISTMIVQASRAIGTAINAEFSGIAAQNGILVQASIDDAASTARNMTDYLQSAYERKALLAANTASKSADAQPAAAEQTADPAAAALPAEDGTLSQPAAPEGKKSIVYSTEISDLSYEVENYILNNAWSIVKGDADIAGVGVFFEPNALDDAIADYSLYVSSASAKGKKAESMGAYSEYSQQDYYRIAKESKAVYITPPYTHDGVLISSISYPLLYNNAVQGVIVVDINVSNFSKIKTTDEKYPTMYVDVFTEENIIAFDSESMEYVGSRMDSLVSAEDYTLITDAQSLGEAFAVNTLKNDGSSVSRYYYPIQCGTQIWWASSALNTSDLYKDVYLLVLVAVILGLFVLTALIIVTAVYLRKTLKPINNLVKAAQEIEKGNLDIEVSYKSNDEIGALSAIFASMTQNLRFIIHDTSYLLDEMAKGNFEVHSGDTSRYVGKYSDILEAVRTINRNLSRTLSDINIASDQVSVGADQVSAGAQNLSQGATEQASSIQELSATIMEIAQKTHDNAATAQEASALSLEAGEQVAISNRQMEDLMGAMNEITDTSNQIGKIIKTIEDIAFQTNILALNAAIEAARAGSAGKGFAVVADEVRNLAGKSSEAAKNTTELIRSSLSAIEKGRTLTDETAQSLEIVVKKASMVNDKIQIIAQASNEQSGAISQVNTGVEQISAVVQTNSATSEESAAASEELSGQAQMLKELVSRFKLRKSDTAQSASETDEPASAFAAPAESTPVLSQDAPSKY